MGCWVAVWAGSLEESNMVAGWRCRRDNPATSPPSYPATESRNEVAAAIDLLVFTDHQLGGVVGLLADVLEQLGIFLPAQAQGGGGPRRGVGARIVDRDL